MSRRCAQIRYHNQRCCAFLGYNYRLNRSRLKNVVQLRPDQTVSVAHWRTSTLGHVAAVSVHRAKLGLSAQMLKSWGSCCQSPVVNLVGVTSPDAVELVPPIRRPVRPGRVVPVSTPGWKLSAQSHFLRKKPPQPGWLRHVLISQLRSCKSEIEVPWSQCLARAHSRPVHLSFRCVLMRKGGGSFQSSSQRLHLLILSHGIRVHCVNWREREHQQAASAGG